MDRIHERNHASYDLGLIPSDKLSNRVHGIYVLNSISIENKRKVLLYIYIYVSRENLASCGRPH